MTYKKGAMFGLDARIALAIFGALSVISGAALYSAIQNAKVTAIVTELEGLSKAYQAYVLDTGVDLPKEVVPTPHDIALKTLELIESSVSGWQGPYTSVFTESQGTTSHPTHEFENSKYTYIFYIRATDESSFGGYTAPAPAQKTCEGNSLPCFNWIGLNDVKSLEIAKAIDIAVDGEEGANTGRLRVRNHSTTKYAIYYQIMPSLIR